ETTTETAVVLPDEIIDVSELYLDNVFGEDYAVPEVVETTVPETEAPVIETTTEAAVSGITDEEYILLCNCVAHEAGSDVITVENKAKVVEVIMNRVASSSFPNTIYGVITQKYQFSGSSSYANLSSYTSKVTDNVKAAVDLYFSNPSSFNQGYLYFYGDGSQNHFRT
ncbi:MAG: cell wall hydrolase, partial [Oscillospiraceae bacterium]|nr:cell wall hydrolase [Oscillospiraceae bacterium]